MNSQHRSPKTVNEGRVEEILSTLTIEEKLGQLVQLDENIDIEEWITERHVGSFLNLSSEKINQYRKLNTELDKKIPIIQAVDAIHGHCFYDGATVFPTPLAMSCSWDSELFTEVGKITAKEMRVTGFHWTFAPNLDLARDPRWGRVNETLGEDPFLVGELASAMIDGLQNNGKYSVAACPKHFAAYGESYGGRDSVESEVSERKLRTLFLPPFEKVIKSGALTIMAGYEAVNGVPCSMNDFLLKDILVGEWDFQGVVVTDYDNVTRLHTEQYVVDNLYDASLIGAQSGNHIMMATPKFYHHILDAVESGKISIETINEMVRRVIRIKLSLGLFESEEETLLQEASEVIGNCEHREMARKASEESIVLLKNNGVLPLDQVDKDTKIAVIGPNAVNRVSQLGDWGIRENFGKRNHEFVDDHEETYVSIRAGMENVFGKDNIWYHKGCSIESDDHDIPAAIELAKDADYIVAVVGDNLSLNGEIKDRATLDLTGKQNELLKALKDTGKPLIIVVISGKPLILNWMEDNADAILEAFNPGLEGGNAVANIISGKVNPSGKLTVSFPRHVGTIPVFYNQIPGWHGNSNGTGDYVDITQKPLYPFGYGLSYTTFEYSDLELLTDQPKTVENIEIAIKVKNTGGRKGSEVVQVYFNDVYSSMTTVNKSLISFRKVELDAGEEKIVKFVLPPNSFALVDRNNKRRVEPGLFEIMVGGSSDDRDLNTKKFEMSGENHFL